MNKGRFRLRACGMGAVFAAAVLSAALLFCRTALAETVSFYGSGISAEWLDPKDYVRYEGLEGSDLIGVFILYFDTDDEWNDVLFTLNAADLSDPEDLYDYEILSFTGTGFAAFDQTYEYEVRGISFAAQSGAVVGVVRHTEDAETEIIGASETAEAVSGIFSGIKEWFSGIREAAAGAAEKGDKNMVFVIIIAIIVLAVVFRNIRVVPQEYVSIIERLGKYHTTWEAGLHVKIPIIDNMIKKISLKEQVLDFPPQPVITKDNVTMQIDSVVFIKVFDPRLFTYGAEDPIGGLKNLTATTLRSIVGEMELDQTLTSREAINAKMQAQLDEATDKWGIQVIRVEIKNIQPPQEISDVMTKQMRAEREKREQILEAEAHRQSVETKAEGDKKAAILKAEAQKESKILAAEAERQARIATAEGEAKAIELVYQAQADGLRMLKEADVSDSVLKLKSIEALKDVANGQASKIYVPTDMADAFAALGTAGDALRGGSDAKAAEQN